MKMKILYVALTLLLISFTSAATYENGHLAKAFFEQFQRTSPGDPNDFSTWDMNFQGTASYEFGVGDRYDLSKDYDKIHYNMAGKAIIYIHEENGMRCSREINNPGTTKYPNSMGGYFLPDTRDGQFSYYFPSTLAANRKSFLMRLPDVISKGSETIDINDDEDGYARLLIPHVGNFNQNDGPGLTDGSFENSNWHFYWARKSAWEDSGARQVSVKNLGNYYKLITFSVQPYAQRSGRKLFAGFVNAVQPNLAAFKDDPYALQRTESRFYFRTVDHNQARFTPLDSFSDEDIFNDGVAVADFCGISFWYEDPEVQIKAYPDYDPEGTNFVQLAFPPAATGFEYLPVEIINTGSTPSTFIHYENTGNIPNFNPLREDVIDLFEDRNGNRILDNDELNYHIGSRTPTIPPGGRLKAIVRLNRQRFTNDATSNIGFSLSLDDPNDPQTLKGASLMIQLDKGAPTNVAIQDILYFGPRATTSANRVPTISYQVQGPGGTINSGATIQAGTQLTFTSSSTDPDGDNINTVLYFPDGTSRVMGSRTLTYSPTKLGENKFLYHASDGRARSFSEFSINVIQGTSRSPIAKISSPRSSTTYPAGETAFFATYINNLGSHDPDGNANTQFGRGIQSIRWDFGDGNTATNDQFPEHIYQSPGTYIVTLTITDDEGVSSTDTTSLTITQTNQPPTAILTPIDEHKFMQFGVIEISAQNSIDPNGNNDILGYNWQFTGPDGEYTDRDHLILISDNSRLLFNTWQAGTYEIFVKAYDKWGKSDETTIEVEVAPWDGIIRASAMGFNSGPGGLFGSFKTENVEKGWTVFGGNAHARLGYMNGNPITIEAFNTLQHNNDQSLLPNTPPHLEKIFNYAVTQNYGTKINTIANLPQGTYSIQAYLYNEDRASPGTQYAVRFGDLRMDVTIPENPTYQDFVVTGILNHPGGDLQINGIGAKGTSPYTPLAGFTISPSEPLPCEDNDNDGFDAVCFQGNDCNDNDPNINPNAIEICGNGIDNNCNGNADEACPEVDTTPPSIQSVSAQRDSITVTFNEAIQSSSAQNTANYQAGTTINNVQLINPNTVQLSTNPHEDGTYTLTIQNIQDLNGNSMQSTTRQYSFTTQEPSSCTFANDQILYLPFNDGTANDVSGNNLNGQINSATYLSAGGHQGTGGFDFDAVDDFIEIANNPMLNNFPNGITLAAWIYPRDGGHQYGSRVISKRIDAGGTDTYAMFTSLGRFYFRLNGEDHSTSNAVVTNTWSHVVMTYDGSSAKIYLNNNLIRSDGFSEQIDSSSRPLHIGDRENEERRFNGIIDEAMIYNRALTETEIQSLYQGCSSEITYNDADTNKNGEIEMTELLVYIGRWKRDEVSISQVLQAITLWKQG